MKLIKFSIPALAAAMLAMSSCSDKGYSDIYEAPTVNYSFETAKQTYAFVGEMPEYVSVYVTRNTTVGEADVPVNFICENPDITADNAVHFANGEVKTELKVNINPNLECGPANNVKIILDGDVYSYNIKTINLTIRREYTYSSIGDAYYTSPEFIEYSWPVEVLRANENKHVFRIPDPFWVLYDDENATGLAYMEFECNDDFSAASFTEFDTAWILQGYNIAWIPLTPGYVEDNVITVGVRYGAYSGGSYAGYFWQGYETLEMPDGWNK